MNLQQICLSNEKTETNVLNVSDGNSLMKLVKCKPGIFLNSENRNIAVILEKYFPELDLNITEESVMCVTCYEHLQKYLTFLNNYLNIEEKIKEYCQLEGTNSKGQIQLKKVLHFKPKNMLKYQYDQNCLNTVDTKKECRKQNVKSAPFDIEIKNENSIETEYQELHIKEEDANFKTERDDYNRYEDCTVPLNHLEGGSLPNEAEVSRTGMDNYNMCEDKTQLKSGIQNHRSTFRAKWYKCTTCAFQADCMDTIKRHIIIHRNISEVIMHQCEVCGHQSKHKCSLQRHILIHKNASDATMYRCGTCEFQTRYKHSFQQHILNHKDISEVTIYKCKMCEYQSRFKHSIHLHMLSHRDKSYKCSLCEYKAKDHAYLRQHFLIHEDTFEVKTYKCDVCRYQSKHKHCLSK